MLDNETKRRIDTARDILVGKLPDPKSQVEQITIALIYKFMDDMDAQSVEFGGEPSFFVGDYEKYGWRKLFVSNISGHERIALYGEAIVKLNQNPQLPQLFRDIFKNAFLPYRDPETLTLFLKKINEFKYDHSERLGDAFEYLLSVLGSQGDAGQFRTPRHIIDFIVETLAPKKNETVCDPACGTAGFLISSFKHILKANTKQNNGDLLSPDDRRKLMQNFIGYDISPDMVRLSLVNLYLHGFPDPHIHEYDTLTSEERWSEHFDIVMANPPFMSPKGGIKPHKKFSINANRSEVLFVDYIAEHIHPTHGRAGIIVPEGIIFQSAGAYKGLRKMLVDKAFLYAVVSLPAGVFNPYAGVKTSVLLMDKTLAGKTDKILFVKIQNDGFGLGPQRRELATSDLPDALNLIRDFQAAVLQGDDSRFAGEDLPLQAVAVEKTQIAANGDYNLSGDRYKTTNQKIHHKFDIVQIGEVCDLMTGGTPTSSNADYYENGTIKWLVSGDIHKRKIYDCEGRITELGMQNSNAKYLPQNSVLIALNGQGKTRGTVALLETKATCNQSLVAINPKDKSRLLSEFLYVTLVAMYSQIRNLTGDEQRSGLNMPIIRALKIPLPPLSIQKEIVEKIEGFQRIIDGAKAVVENYKPQIDISPDWEMVELGKVLQKVNESINPQNFTGKVDYIGLENIESQTGNLVGEVSTDYQQIKSIKSCFQYGDILYGKLRPNLNKVFLADFEGICSTDIFVLRGIEQLSDSGFYASYLRSEKFNQEVLKGIKGAQLPRVGYDHFSATKIPCPPIERQKDIALSLESIQSLVNSNKELITIFEAKIKDEINKLWEQ